MDVIEHTERLIRATSLDQLRNEHGRARMNMPYWLELEEGLIFQFVGKHTDPDALQLQINHGLVWVQEKYSVDG